MRWIGVQGGRRNLALTGLGVLGVLLVAGAAVADDPAAIVRTRIGHFKDIGRAAHTIQIEVGKPSPDAAAVADAARRIEGLADEIPSWFPAGSGPETGVATQARAEIWDDPSGFRAKAAALGASARALEMAATADDQGAIKSGFMALAQACQGCHSAFRSGDH